MPRLTASALRSQMYQAAKNVIDTRVYNLDTPFDEIFPRRGRKLSESVWELQCTATVAQPATNDLGSQFCQVQGCCRGSGTSNLGWGWHMADQSIVDVFEEGDPRQTRRCSTSLDFEAVACDRSGDR